MSQSADLVYELEQERKRELYLERITENTKVFTFKFLKMYDELRLSGYYDIIPKEMSQLKNDLDVIKENIDFNPELCVEVSRDIGDYIYSLRNIAKNTKLELNKIETKKREYKILKNIEQKNEASKALHSLLRDISDPIERDFAYDLSLDLVREIENSKQIDKRVAEENFTSILKQAKKKAKEWKNNQKEILKEDSIRENIRTQIEKLKNEKLKNMTKVIENLEEIENYIDDKNTNDLQKKIQETLQKAEDIVMDEKIRQETVKSIFKILKHEGFIVNNPTIDREKDTVILTAKRPSGNQAICKIQLDGKFSYKFDGYKGMGCKKDIENMSKAMQEIYGFNIKDKKITWKNPDMNYSDAHSMPSSSDNKKTK